MTDKKEPRHKTGHPHFSREDPRYYSSGPANVGTHREVPVIPTANPNWLPQARSWYNSLPLSGQSAFYEASDWATAVSAAQMLDTGLRTTNGAILANFVRLSERLGVTHLDRVRARIVLDDPESEDQDEDAADNIIRGWQARLDARNERPDNGAS